MDGITTYTHEELFDIPWEAKQSPMPKSVNVNAPCLEVEIVRCRDCVFWASVENQYAAGDSKPVAVVMGCTRHGEPSKPEDFCSWALRRQHG